MGYGNDSIVDFVGEKRKNTQRSENDEKGTTKDERLTVREMKVDGARQNQASALTGVAGAASGLLLEITQAGRSFEGLAAEKT
jgi:hypothetical protein